jgi:ABC-type Fe3+-hydroxamate transport system substrate-binding protein
MPFPQSIVSVVPSQTELLHYLGLGEAVTGITKFCIHPDEWFREKKRVGGTKTLHLEAIRSLKPDLILANRGRKRTIADRRTGPRISGVC